MDPNKQRNGNPSEKQDVFLQNKYAGIQHEKPSKTNTNVWILCYALIPPLKKSTQVFHSVFHSGSPGGFPSSFGV
jgi:hypothetical protein